MSAIKTDEDNKGVQVYLRIRPSKKRSRFISRDEFDEKILNFKVPKDEKLIINNSRTSYSFHFNDIFNEDITQDNVFQIVGKPAVLNALAGFNSTVFAYGQTGSGKTFTITGGAGKSHICFQR
mmetsp:Transcript_16178/g.24647  ORF Transcript_16178/g.24647 Transcript_16178/m.24647 type:complete len:123 (-) Transcript_16178:46-414(-)